MSEVRSAEIEDLAWRVDRELRHEGRRHSAAAMRRSERERRAPQLRVRRRLAIVLPLLAATLAVNVAGVGPLAVAERGHSIEETTRNVEMAVRLGVNMVERYRREKGALPPDLASVGLDPAHGWTYTTTGGDQFQLALSHAGRVGHFDSRGSGIAVRAGGEDR
jgi:hypothetical protein